MIMWKAQGGGDGAQLGWEVQLDTNGAPKVGAQGVTQGMGFM